jgi:hypothetical protein
MLLYAWIVELKLNQINALQAKQATATAGQEAKALEEEIAVR